MSRGFRIIGLIVFLMVFLACNSSQNNPPQADLQPSSGAPQFVFPHPDGWGMPDQHGPAVATFGQAVCFKCHGEKSSSGIKGPDCLKCHPLYPHETNWKEPDQHGKVFFEQGKAACTTQCHGTDLGGGLSGKSCNSCHATFPHAESWEEITGHGVYAFSNGVEGCLECHDLDPLGDTDKKACRSCHKKYPHEETWVESSKHGSFVRQNGQASCTTACHGIDLKGGKSKTACADCHESYPHPAGWGREVEEGEKLPKHAVWAKTRLPSCRNSCHGDDFSGGTSNKVCSTCHPYPHDDTWAVKPEQGATEHGAYVLSQGGSASCAGVCHGTDFMGGDSKVSCKQSECHAQYPHAAEWGRSVDPQKAPLHGPWVLANGKTECKNACHGTNLNGGTSETPCDKCHTVYPHVSGWQNKAVHGASPDRQNSNCTTFCHGSNLRGGDSNRSCYDSSCHTLGLYPHEDGWEAASAHGVAVNTYGKQGCLGCHQVEPVDASDRKACHGCHPLYPHQTNWVERVSPGGKTVHGASVTSPSTDATCRTECHGSDLSGGLSRMVCNDCHEKVPHPAGWGRIIEEGQTAPMHGVWARTRMNSCRNTCHGLDLSGGSSGRSCNETDCHSVESKFPHPTNWALPSEHGAYLSPEGQPVDANRKITLCASCHGSDLRGGTSQKSCYAANCHPSASSFPHTAGWAAGAQHAAGYLAVTDVTARRQFLSTNCGTSCHGANFDRGLQGKSCRLCHSDFPHATTAWANLGESLSSNEHGGVFKQKMQADPSDIAACTMCHGEDYSRYANIGKACQSCHGANFGHLSTPAYLTTWSQGGGHGSNFANNNYNSRSDERMNPCWNCHGRPVAFTDFDTRESLRNQSDCYACHPAYPHVSYRDKVWQATCRQEIPSPSTSMGHKVYFNQPPQSIWGDTTPLSSQPSACGQAGSCHTNGARGITIGHEQGEGSCSECHAGQEDRSPCLACHSLDYNGGAVSPLLSLPDCTPTENDVSDGNPSVSTTPINGAQRIATALTVTLRFSEAMRRETLTAPGALYLRDEAGAVINPQANSLSCSDDWCKTLTANFSGLASSTTYSIRLAATVTDWSGQTVNPTFSATFTTVAAAPVPHPFKVDYSRTRPSSGQNFPRNSPPTQAQIYFNEKNDGTGTSYRVYMPSVSQKALVWDNANLHVAHYITLQGGNCEGQECEYLYFDFPTGDPTPSNPGEYTISLPNVGDKNWNMLVSEACGDADECYAGGCPSCNTEWTFTVAP